jgi:chemotaxis protein CheY-P-specific phosphatase CheC/CheY-like chemotaxis protein
MPHSIIICDDSGMARKQMARTLPEGWDVDVQFATNGKEALFILRDQAIDVMFLDLNMPVLDGYQTLAAIKRLNIQTKVIVVSGDIQPEAHQRVKNMGAIDFIKKPVSAETLANVLAEAGITWDATQTVATPVKNVAAGIKVDVRDGIQEVANVAMGQAGDLLARLLGAFVQLPIPSVSLLEPSDLQMAIFSADMDSVSVVCQGFIGAKIAGEAVMIFHDSSYQDIANLMKYNGEIDTSTELELLMDISNILIGACLNGIARQLDINFSQSHPMVLGQHCNTSDLISANSMKWKETLSIEINYKIEDFNIACDLLLLFAEDSIPTLEQKIGYLIE